MPERGRGRASSRSSSKRTSSRSKSRVRKELSQRMKGLFHLKGSSKKSKKNLRSDNHSVEASTHISLQAVDDTKTSKKQAPESPQKSGGATLQLVLLLMDPDTRRFELLQLEFDSLKARVADIIAQIPISVTEHAIRSQNFDAVIDASGKQHVESVQLVDFCTTKKVLVAHSSNISVKESIRLARPILSDTQVSKMLKSSGFDVSGWEKKDSKSSRKTGAKSRSATSSTQRSSGKSSGKVTSVLLSLVAVAVLCLILHTFNKAVSSPIEVGMPLRPGTRRSRCGLMGYIPTNNVGFLPNCTNSYLKVHNDGTVTLSGDDGEVDFFMWGGVCDKKDCVDGIELTDDGSVRIGGRRVKSALFYGSQAPESLTPWPFETAPKLSVRTLNKVATTS